MIFRIHIVKYLFLLFPLLDLVSISGQEMLIFVSPAYNGAVQKKVNPGLKAGSSIELPFFDDFSDYYYTPNPDKWEDNCVFINNTYAVNPPSIGVATFDGVNNKGEFYNSAGYGNSFVADTLTSRPINLNYPGDQTIFLSFYFQPGGLGDYPEAQDSIMLDFYVPETNTWDNNVRSYAGYDTTIFKKAIIQINDQKYLKDGFKFRFRNKVTLSLEKSPSKVINCDHWNIDYIKLDRGRNSNDTIPNDMAFYLPMKSVLKNYESMPWKHFLTNPTGQLGKSVYSYVYNNDRNPRLIDTMYFSIYDNSGDEPVYTFTAGSWNFEPFGNHAFDPPFSPYTFLTNTADSASFNIKSRLVTNAGDPKINNEQVYIQKFYDYYAYDDGTAEAGYGLTDEGTQNAQLACKFNCIKEDTLKAIQMYFNRSYLDKNRKYFYLTIWDDNNGKPGNIIYKRQGYRPEFENELNKFHTYIIEDTVLVLSGVFYVGWIQTTTDLLNLGFDFNRDHKENNFYNINGQWVNSSYKGSLMIRPFFGKFLTTGSSEIEKPEMVDVKIFPNPAKDEIKIRIGNSIRYQQVTISIYNISGILVNQNLFKEDQSLDLSGLKSGTYIIRLTDKTKKLNYSQKLIKFN